MDLVRWLKRDKFDARKNRFTRIAFRKSSGTNGSLSLVDEACAIAASATVPEHGKKFYPKLIDDPVVWWSFSETLLPAGSKISRTPSDSGDLCHCEVVDVSDDALAKMIHDCKPDAFMIEDGTGVRHTTLSDLIEA